MSGYTPQEWTNRMSSDDINIDDMLASVRNRASKEAGVPPKKETPPPVIPDEEVPRRAHPKMKNWWNDWKILPLITALTVAACTWFGKGERQGKVGEGSSQGIVDVRGTGYYGQGGGYVGGTGTVRTPYSVSRYAGEASPNGARAGAEYLGTDRDGNPVYRGAYADAGDQNRGPSAGARMNGNYAEASVDQDGSKTVTYRTLPDGTRIKVTQTVRVRPRGVDR